MGEVISLELYRAKRARQSAPGRRYGRPYRYDPGPLEGPHRDKAKPSAASDPKANPGNDPPKAG